MGYLALPACQIAYTQKESIRDLQPDQAARETVPTHEAAQILGVGTPTVIRMIHRGDLQGHKKTPAKRSAFRVYVDSIEEVKRQRSCD